MCIQVLWELVGSDVLPGKSRNSSALQELRAEHRNALEKWLSCPGQERPGWPTLRGLARHITAELLLASQLKSSHCQPTLASWWTGVDAVLATHPRGTRSRLCSE